MKHTLNLLAVVGLSMMVAGSAISQAPKSLVVEAKLSTKEKNGTETVVAMPKAVVQPSTKADISLDDGNKGVKLTVTAGNATASGKHQIEIQMTEKDSKGKVSTVKFPKVSTTTNKSVKTDVSSNGNSYTVELIIKPE